LTREETERKILEEEGHLFEEEDEERRYYEADHEYERIEILTQEDAIEATLREREQGIHISDSALRNRMYSVRPSKETPIINENILFEKINYIDLDKKFHADVSTESVLKGLNLGKHILVLVAAETRTARLFVGKEFEEHRAKSRISHRKTGSGKKAKSRQLQMTWNIGDNDLRYRLLRANAYLKKGERLDIILGSRKSKLLRDKDQRDAMLATIRKTLEPYGYEWMKMSMRFPNVELWFQGYDPKKVKEVEQKAAEQKEAEQNEAEQNEAEQKEGEQREGETVTHATEDQQPIPETVNSTPDPEVDISGQDDQYLSEEAAQKATFKVRDRARQLQEAEEKWKALFGPKNQDDPYWKSLSDPSYIPPEPSFLPPKQPPPSSPKKNTPRKAKNHDVEAVKAEFDRKLSDTKVLEQQQELERLKSMATQFAKLGSGKKSMFGGKLAGK